MMASKQRTSLRKKQKIKTDRSQLMTISENEDDVFEVKTPNRRIAGAGHKTGHTKGLSPGFRSPVSSKRQSPGFLSPISARSKHSSPDQADRTLDESSDLLSQVPTPSKWDYLLPDFNSQPEGSVAEVMWDCASPDAVKYLRRVTNSNKDKIKELINKFVKEPTVEERSKSPTYDLPLLRESLQRMQKKKNAPKKPRGVNKKKQKRLARLEKEAKERKERQRELLGQMISAVERKQELEAKERQAKQRESAGVPAPASAASGTETEEAEEEKGGGDNNDDDDDDDDDCWEDDDLFENNSMIIAATQNPYQFLRESNSTKTSTPILSAQKRRGFQCQGGCGARRSEDCCCAGATNNSSRAEDTQTQDVIPPTFVSDSPKAKLQNIKRTNLFLTVFSKESVDSAETSLDIDIQAMGLESKGRTPERCAKSAMCDRGKSPCVPAFSSKFHGSVAETKKGRNVPMGLSSREPPKEKGLFSAANRSEQSRSDFQVNQKSSLSSEQSRNVFQEYKKTGHSALVRNGQTSASSSHKSSDAMFDDEVSDDLFLAISEPCDVSDSQKIQEYPTQAPAKLSTHMTLASTKPASPSVQFTDDLDPEILASIIEYDSSFSDSPVTRKTKAAAVKTIAPDVRSPEHSHHKQLKLQGGTKATCVGSSSSNFVNSRKVCSPRGDPARGISNKALISVRPKVVSTKAAPFPKPRGLAARAVESSKQGQWSSLSSSSSSSESNGAPGPHSSRAATTFDRVVPSFAEKVQNRSKPLSSLALGKGVIEKPVQSGKKFTFRPTQSSLALATTAAHSAGLDLPRARAQPALNMPPSASNSAGPMNRSSSLDVSCSQLKLDSADDLMDDDPLYESQIMAILDEAESQATEQKASQAASSQGVGVAFPKCSQDEIEKKRQAAMERRRRSKTRT